MKSNLHKCASSYKAISGTGILFQKGLIFLGNDKNWISFVFTVLPKHIKIKSFLNYKSVCGQVVKTSDLSPAQHYVFDLSQVQVPTVLD